MDNLQYIDEEMELNDQNGEMYKTTIRQWYMTALLIDEEPCIQSIGQIGISNRYHFVCKTEHLSHVGRLLDEYFDGLSVFMNPQKQFIPSMDMMIHHSAQAE